MNEDQEQKLLKTKFSDKGRTYFSASLIAGNEEISKEEEIRFNEKIRQFIGMILYRSGYISSEYYIYDNLSFFIYSIVTQKMKITLPSYKYNFAVASLVLCIKMWCDFPKLDIKFINDNFYYPRVSAKYIWFELSILNILDWNIFKVTYDCFFLKSREFLIKELNMTSVKILKPRFRVASFDIGKENFAEWVEEFDGFKIRKLRKDYKLIPKKLQRKSTGKISPEIENILNELYLAGKRIHMGVYDIRSNTEDKLEIETRENLFQHLEKFRKVWDTCTLFVIEQQFLKLGGRMGAKGAKYGTEVNIDAIKISECLFTWLKLQYPDRLILFFPSTMKTKVFTDKPLLKKQQRKDFTRDKSYEVAQLRGDEELLILFQLKKDIYKKQLNDKKREVLRKTFEHLDENMRYMGEKVLDRQKFDDFTDSEFQCRAAVYKIFIAKF